MAGWLDMGAHGAYVWPAYAAAAAILGGLVWASLTAGARARRDLERLERERRGGRRA